jgi:hypothetical protein
MKIKSFIFLAAVIFLVSSCVSTSSWDESLPPEQTATLMYVGTTIKSYNGITVNWEPAAMGGLEVKIPAGESEFIADIVTSGFTARDVRFKQSFEAGKSYRLYVGVNNGAYGLIIIEDGSSTATKKFAPFEKL